MNSAQLQDFESSIEAALQAGDHTLAQALAHSYLAASGDYQVAAANVAQSPAFRAAYLAAQVYLAIGQLRRVLEILDPWLPRCPDLPQSLSQRVYLIAAEAAARLNRSAESHSYLELSERVSESPPLLIRLRAARVRLWLGQLSELASTLVELQSELASVGDAPNLALLLNDEGLARDRSGDFERAAVCCRRALQILGNGSSGRFVRADALLQLGRFAHLRGNLQASLDCYACVQVAVEPTAAPWFEAHLRRLLVRLDLNQWQQVARDFSELKLNSSDLPEELRGLFNMVAILAGGELATDASLEGRGFDAARRGDITAARELYLEAQATATGDERRAKLAVALGSLAVAQADSREAERWLAEAEQTARVKELPEVLWRTYQLQGELSAQLSGQDEQARSYFEQAIAVSERQSRQLKLRADASTYNRHRHSVLHQLLRLAGKRGDAPRAFEIQELTRGRLLWDLCRSAGLDQHTAMDSPALTVLDQQIMASEEQLQTGGASSSTVEVNRYSSLVQQRERLLEDLLRNRSRVDTALLPKIPALDELQSQLSALEVYLAPTLLGDDIFLLIVRRAQAEVVWLSNCAAEVRAAADRFQQCISQQLSEYAGGMTLGDRQRADLNQTLQALGGSQLGERIHAEICLPGQRVFWATDGELHGLPLPAFRSAGRYWVADAEFVTTFGGSLLAHQLRRRRPWTWLPRKLLAVAESPSVLPMAETEARRVLSHFWRTCLLRSNGAGRLQVARELPRATICHFACHAYFDEQHPLSAFIRLPSGESWRALDWLTHPVSNLRHVTLSACRSATVSASLGNEVFGLVTGVLGAGVGSVLAGFWSVADAETSPLMESFYREVRTCDPATAIARVQRQQAADPESSPLFWAAWGLFGNPGCLGEASRFGGLIDRVCSFLTRKTGTRNS